MSGCTSPFLVATLLAACAAATRADAQGTRVESIRITATIAAPIEGLAADGLAPEVRALATLHAAAPRATNRWHGAERAAGAPARYRVVVRLAADSTLPAGVSIVLADADGRERTLEPGRAVTIARGLTASEARSAVVRMRVRGGGAGGANVEAIPLVFEVTSESALAM